MTTTRPAPKLRTRHFDVAADEPEPITFTWKDETYRCRGAVPALPVLKGMRVQVAGGLSDEKAQEVGVEFLEAIFEPGELERILRTGISLEKLMGIAEQVMAMYNGEGGPGEGAPPVTGDDSSAPSSTPGTS